MVIATLCFVSLTRTSLDKKVSCQIVRAPLQEVLSTLGKQAGVDIRLNVANRDYSSTVYVKDRPLKQVLDALASVHGLNVDAGGSPIRLVGTGFRGELDTYVKQEDSLLWNEALAKLSALANLTNRPYMADPNAPEPKEVAKETPAEWAKSRIGQWPYYAAGMWYATATRHNPFIKTFFRPMTYVGFWVHRPSSQAELEESNAWMDENSAALEGRQIALYVSPVTYELRIAGVDPRVKAEPSRRFPYAYASPPASLANTPFAKKLASWVTPANSLDAEILNKQMKDSEPPDSEKWFGDKISLATVLQSLHRQTGLDVVSDAYRISLHTSPSEVAGRTGKEWIKNLAEKELCFTRYESGMLMVRHPGFWRLQQTEPTDASLKWLEAKGRPKIPDFAEFMVANYLEMQTRFDSASTCLTRFDPTPIQTSGPAFWFIGRIPHGSKNAYLNGEVYSAEFLANGTQGSTDIMKNALAARHAPIYGASVTGLCQLMLRQGPSRQSYPLLMGYDRLIEPNAMDVFRFSRLAMSPDQRSGELRMWFEGRGMPGAIVYQLNVP